MAAVYFAMIFCNLELHKNRKSTKILIFALFAIKKNRREKYVYRNVFVINGQCLVLNLD